MSSNDTEEPMDYSEDPPTSHDKCAENKDEDQVTLSVLVKWPEGSPPQKRKVELEKALQTWANNSNCQQDWKVLKVSEDGRAVIKIKPAPAERELQELSGKALDRKDGKKVTIMSVSLTPLETQRPGDASMDPPPSPVSEPQQEQLARKSSSGSSAAVSTEEEETCTFHVPVSHYWYVNHIYKEEIKRIERDNGVKMNAEVIVTFKADQKGGVPKNVQSEFINVVQKSLSESNGLVIPLKSQDPEELKDTLKVFLKKENKLLLTLSSEEMTVCGPIQSQAAISKSLNIPQKTSTNTKTSAGESTWASQDTSLNIGMNIEDPLINTGLTMEQNYWKLMTTSFDEHVAKIKAKFGVDFKESGIGQDKVKVKAHYQGSGGNASMESHAVRALLHLYQKIATSPMSFNLSNVDHSEGASSGPVMNGSEYSMRNTTLTKTNTSAGQSTLASQDTSLNIGMNIEDPLVNTGLTMEESYWKLMTTSFDEHVAKIKAKFGVDFKESGIGQDKVKVKAHYQGSGGNASMESHAVRALLHLYQKIATSPMSFNLSNVDHSEGASSGPVMNGSEYSMRNTTLTKTNTSAGQSTLASQDTSLNIGMNIEDPLVNTGLTMEESYWKLMTTSFDEHVAKIKAKFGVDFKESGIGQGKVRVKAHYKRSGGNASMESHAVRALLHLYQKIATSPMSFTQDHGARGFGAQETAPEH